MKQLLLVATIMSQMSYAGELTQISSDLGKVYQKAVALETRGSKQEELRKQIVESLSANILSVTFFPLRELRSRLRSLGIRFESTNYGLMEMKLLPSDSLPKIEECNELKQIFAQYEEALESAEKSLSQIYYSSSPYWTELSTFKGILEPMRANFASSLNMQEGIVNLEAMLSELEAAGFRWERRVLADEVVFEFDLKFFQQRHRVNSPEQLGDKDETLKRILAGPWRKLNGLQSSHTYLSRRYGLKSFELALRQILVKLK